MGTACRSRASGCTQYVTHACHLIVMALETRETRPHFGDEEKEEQIGVPLALSARDVTNSSQCGLIQAFILVGSVAHSRARPPDGSPGPCLVWAGGSCWSADRSSHTLTLSHACSVGTQPQQHFDGKIYEESNYCCWEGIKTIFHSPHPRATSAGATLGAPHVPSLFMARHHGHRLQLQFSANRFWSRDSRKHQAPALPPFPGLPSAPPTTKPCGAVDRDSSCSVASLALVRALSLYEHPPNPPLVCLSDSYLICNTQLQCHLLWETFSDAALF